MAFFFFLFEAREICSRLIVCWVGGRKRHLGTILKGSNVGRVGTPDVIKDRPCGARNERWCLADWLEFLKQAAAKSNRDFGVFFGEGSPGG